MKKDAGFIAFFAAVGILIAWFASAPLRRPVVASLSVPKFAAHTNLYAEGIVSLAPSFVSQAPALFIIARPTDGGMPVAVKRIASPVFPVTFFLTAADSMVAGPFYDGDLTLIARLDADGSAGAVQADDVEISVPISAKGDRSVQLVLDGKAPIEK